MVIVLKKSVPTGAGADFKENGAFIKISVELSSKSAKRIRNS